MSENMKKEYTADSLQSLSEIEAVRKRPGMYIGSTDLVGLHHLVWEIVDNAVDEAKEGYGKKIDVTIHTDGSISVEDQGRGVPCDINKKENRSGFDMVYFKLHSGGKFDESNYKSAGGLHGVGGAVVNFLSELWRFTLIEMEMITGLDIQMVKILQKVIKYLLKSLELL